MGTDSPDFTAIDQLQPSTDSTGMDRVHGNQPLRPSAQVASESQTPSSASEPEPLESRIARPLLRAALREPEINPPEPSYTAAIGKALDTARAAVTLWCPKMGRWNAGQLAVRATFDAQDGAVGELRVLNPLPSNQEEAFVVASRGNRSSALRPSLKRIAAKWGRRRSGINVRRFWPAAAPRVLRTGGQPWAKGSLEPVEAPVASALVPGGWYAGSVEQPVDAAYVAAQFGKRVRHVHLATASQVRIADMPPCRDTPDPEILRLCCSAGVEATGLPAVAIDALEGLVWALSSVGHPDFAAVTLLAGPPGALGTDPRHAHALFIGAHDGAAFGDHIIIMEAGRWEWPMLQTLETEIDFYRKSLRPDEAAPGRTFIVSAPPGAGVEMAAFASRHFGRRVDTVLHYDALDPAPLSDCEHSEDLQTQLALAEDTSTMLHHLTAGTDPYRLAELSIYFPFDVPQALAMQEALTERAPALRRLHVLFQESQQRSVETSDLVLALVPCKVERLIIGASLTLEAIQTLLERTALHTLQCETVLLTEHSVPTRAALSGLRRLNLNAECFQNLDVLPSSLEFLKTGVEYDRTDQQQLQALFNVCPALRGLCIEDTVGEIDLAVFPALLELRIGDSGQSTIRFGRVRSLSLSCLYLDELMGSEALRFLSCDVTEGAPISADRFPELRVLNLGPECDTPVGVFEQMLHAQFNLPEDLNDLPQMPEARSIRLSMEFGRNPELDTIRRIMRLPITAHISIDPDDELQDFTGCEGATFWG